MRGLTTILVLSVAFGWPMTARADEAARGEALFKARCATCHSTREGGGQGPGLGGVVGRKAATGRAYGYSKALRATSVTWDKATLDRFLAAPTVFAPGTRMVVAVPAAQERRALIAYLAKLPAISEPLALEKPSRPWTASPEPKPAPAAGTLLTGEQAFGDFQSDAPGVRRRITLADLPAPFATDSARNSPGIADPPAGAAPLVPAGFRVDRFTSDLDNPRLLQVAPNGDVFVAESSAGRVVILRARDGATSSEQTSVFAQGLTLPFGIAFYPPGPDPRFVYVANTNSVVRFPYRNGDLVATGPAQTVIPRLTRGGGGHWTRDVVFSKDGTRMFVSVGSGSNVAEEMPKWPAARAQAWEQGHGLGAAWGDEEGRADVRVFDPDGRNGRVFASGIRNCVGLAIEPVTGDLWCSVNERDGLGDNLVPDYLTSVRDGAFYGWPWFYLGDHEDPRRAGERPGLANQITVPDVLVQPHSASLEMTFYDGAMFPAAYRGDAFAAFHGSWNRAVRTGYKVVRVRFENGRPTGEYDDFLTGFVIDADRVWGRPVGVAVAHDGALLVSEDANGTIWRVSAVP
jgi:glucose/arabinose dehydrogenase/cytochrome c2